MEEENLSKSADGVSEEKTEKESPILESNQGEKNKEGKKTKKEKASSASKGEKKAKKKRKWFPGDERQIELSQILRPVYFILFATLLELINFCWLKLTVTGNEQMLQVLPKYFFLDFGVYLIVAGILFILPKVFSNIVFYIFIGFQVFINIVNATLFKVFGDIFSFDMMKLGTEAKEAFKLEFIDLWSVIINLLVLAAIIVIQIVIDKKGKKLFTLSKLNRIALLVVGFFGCFLMGFTSFTAQTFAFSDTETSVRISESDKYLWDNMHFKLEAYKKFGTYGFYIKSLANLVYKQDEYNEFKKTDLLADLKAGQKSINVKAPLYGDNLIVIMLESFEWFAIDPINTPTLWDLRTKSGISFENFYGKNKTNISEGISILGNLPKDVSESYLARRDLLSVPYTLPNLFKSMGYSANYFHSYRKTFYDRDTINVAMGFDNVYGIEDADLENKSMNFHDWNLDSDYVKSMVDKFIPEEGNFFSFMTTVTTHGSYDRVNERFEDYYAQYDANLDEYKAWMAENTTYVYPENNNKLERCYRQYKCAAMDTDRMVKYILDTLEARGLDENTTLVMYADHNCYFEDIYFNIKGTSKAGYYDIYNYNIPFMIYSKKLTPQKNTTFCNTYDVYPTICDLFGLPYNTAMTQGYDVFSSDIENSVMVSYLSGAFNDKFYTLNIVDMHYLPGSTQEDLAIFKRNACRFYEKQYDIELIYKYGLTL